MTHTFWHSGILIGECDLEDSPADHRQVGGVFHPTPHGLHLLPRLCGFLSASAALKTHLAANGVSPEAMDQRDFEEFVDTTPAGQKMADIGRLMCDVEIRAPDGRHIEVASLAFTDLSELQRLVRDLHVDSANALTDLPPDASRYVVTATLGAAELRRRKAARNRLQWDWSRFH